MQLPLSRLILAVLLVLPGPPTLFAPGVISTPDNERGAAFTPDGDTVYFTKRTADPYYSAICVSTRVHGQWTTPRIASFSGRYIDADPTIAPDGHTLVFASAREGTPHLWIVHRAKNGGWDTPQPIGAPVASDGVDLTPSFGPDGSLYFSSTRRGGKGSLDMYVARRHGGGFDAPTPLVELNTDKPELYPAVSRDGSRLVFESIGRDDEIVEKGIVYGRGDLYMSRRTSKGWGPPVHLPAPINSEAAECCASFSPDGTTMYFTSERSFVTGGLAAPIRADSLAGGLASILNGLGNIYQVSTRNLP